MAEQYDDKKKTVVTPTTTRAENGAREYSEPEKKPFPWWLALIPLALLIGWFVYKGQKPAEDSTPAPVAMRSPAASAPPAASPSAADVASPLADASPADGVSPAADASAAPDAMAAVPSPAASIAGKDEKVHKGSDITVAPPGGASKKGEPLSDVVTFAETPAGSRTALVGRTVKLTDVPVVQVLGDRAFYVGPSNKQQMLVLLDKQLDAGTSGQKISTTAGSKVSLTGVLAALPAAEVMQSTYGITADKYSAMQSEGVYMHATIVQKK